MRRSRKKCRCCGQWFLPEVRSYRRNKSRQNVCSKPECQAWRRRQYGRSWEQNNPDCWPSRGAKHRQWWQAHPDYARAWRARHPGYVARNRQAQRRRDQTKQAFLAKPNPLFHLHVEKLRRIRGLGDLAKPNPLPDIYTRQIDGLCDYLDWRWRLAKPNHIDIRR